MFFFGSRGHSEFFDCLQVLKNQDPGAPNIHDDTIVEKINEDDDENINTIEKAPVPVRAVFANRHRMNDNEHLAWTISCNYQRTMHPIFIHHINRIEETKRKQRQFIYNSLNPIRSPDAVVDPMSTDPAVRGRVDDGNCGNVTLLQQERDNSSPKIISPTPTAVHISILKIQSKT